MKLFKRLLFSLITSSLCFAISAKEYHVAKTGNDKNSGTFVSPLLTIQAAAKVAQPGDVITVHGGVYRERVVPPRGGTSEDKRIIYQAAKGEKVFIKGSEVVRSWKHVGNDTWETTLSNSFFGDFNPYKDTLSGDWFMRQGRVHHTGCVYLKGHWLREATRKEDVLKPSTDNPLWFGETGKKHTTIWAQFKGLDPNQQEVEVNVRQAVFYPDKPGIDYITVSGFTMQHAATPWAPPTAEQIGLIGTHWSKGWIIENNEVSYSICCGITLGKYGDEFDNQSSNSATGYVSTIERALDNGWSKEHVGSHIIRNNHIHDCEQAGIAGSLGAIFSTITGNEIHDIHIRRQFSGMEMAGIKIHAPIDVVIRSNYVYRTWRGIWLDWMAQGAHVTCNLLHDNEAANDLFVEVNHGPFLIDHNLFLSANTLRDISQGGAYAHNLFAGQIITQPNSRVTPYHEAHSTEIAGMQKIITGDNRFYNNIFVSFDGQAPWPERTGPPQEGNFYGLVQFDGAGLPMYLAGNVFLREARSGKEEEQPIVDPKFNPGIKLLKREDGVYLEATFDKSWVQTQRQLVTSELLGRAEIPDLPYEQPDGTSYRLDTDYFGIKRNTTNPAPGPFQIELEQVIQYKVWPGK